MNIHDCIKKFPIPVTRDPFINTPIIHAGFDPKTGEERFWTSTWNSNTGCIGVLFNENGKTKIYKFSKYKGLVGSGAYSAVLEGNDKLWLCSDLGYLTRLTLSSGKCEYFKTGAPEGALVFNCMQRDEKTEKMIAGANWRGSLTCFSFDTSKCINVKTFSNFTKSGLIRGGFKNHDFTYTLRMITNKSALYKWDPMEETIEEKCEIDPRASCLNVIKDSRDRTYIPYMGWLNTDSYNFETGQQPAIEAEWFARIGKFAFGMSAIPSGAFSSLKGTDILKWDMESGNVKVLCSVPNLSFCRMSRNNEIMVVSLYGEFYKFSSEDGSLLLSSLFDSNTQGLVDCIVRIDNQKILGTPFITQRFWILDTESGEGFDAGRAAPGIGQVTRCWNIDGKIYMATYNKGILTEYDPDKRIIFPENPRVVAHSPLSLRPVSHTDDGVNLYYSSNHRYGTLGCVLTKYNTITGRAYYKDNPLDNQHIISLRYNKSQNMLIGTTTFHSDVNVTPVQSDKCFIITICPEDLNVISKVELPLGSEYPRFLCAMNDTKYIVTCSNTTDFILFDILNFNISKAEISNNHGEYIKEIIDTGIYNIILVLSNNQVSIVDISSGKFNVKEILLEDDEIRKIFVSKDSVYAVTPNYIYIVDNVLKKYY